MARDIKNLIRLQQLSAFKTHSSLFCSKILLVWNAFADRVRLGLGKIRRSHPVTKEGIDRVRKELRKTRTLYWLQINNIFDRQINTCVNRAEANDLSTRAIKLCKDVSVCWSQLLFETRNILTILRTELSKHTLDTSEVDEWIIECAEVSAVTDSAVFEVLQLEKNEIEINPTCLPINVSLTSDIVDTSNHCCEVFESTRVSEHEDNVRDDAMSLLPIKYATSQSSLQFFINAEERRETNRAEVFIYDRLLSRTKQFVKMLNEAWRRHGISVQERQPFFEIIRKSFLFWIESVQDATEYFNALKQKIDLTETDIEELTSELLGQLETKYTYFKQASALYSSAASHTLPLNLLRYENICFKKIHEMFLNQIADTTLLSDMLSTKGTEQSSHEIEVVDLVTIRDDFCRVIYQFQEESSALERYRLFENSWGSYFQNANTIVCAVCDEAVKFLQDRWLERKIDCSLIALNEKIKQDLKELQVNVCAILTKIQQTVCNDDHSKCYETAAQMMRHFSIRCEKFISNTITILKKVSESSENEQAQQASDQLVFNIRKHEEYFNDVIQKVFQKMEHFERLSTVNVRQ